ncbi:hypothetical protein CDN98_13185 [Roseateles terrae]|nr:hypothetical protein CDN98_13185 [Roseateles terrae]
MGLKPGRAGAPIHSGNIESFNGKFYDKCLSEHWFVNLPRAGPKNAARRQGCKRPAIPS